MLQSMGPQREEGFDYNDLPLLNITCHSLLADEQCLPVKEESYPFKTSQYASAISNSSGFPGGSAIKIHLPMQKTQSDPRVGKIPWRRKWQPTPVFFLGQEDPLEKEMAIHSSLLA